MVARIPTWFWWLTWILAFSAGNINVVGILGTSRHAITHLTGTTSLLAIALSESDIAAVLHFLGAILAFVFGAVLSGIIIQDVSFKIGRRYPISLLLVSVLLFISLRLLKANQALGVYTAACACGLQNAMMTTFSSATIRTTHLSGMFTDVGIYIGHALRGLPVDLLRLKLCGTIISGYFAGGVLGGILFKRMSYDALNVSVVMALFAAILFWIQSNPADKHST